MRAGISRIMGPVSRRTIVSALVAIVAAAAWAITAASGRHGAQGGASGGAQDATVVRVVDGDTMVAELASGAQERVRFIGIDTPESVKPNTPVQCYALKASAFTKHLLTGREVRLVPDVEARDRYGRMLAYVYRKPDDLFVNAELVRRGFAQTLTIPPNVRFAGEFRVLARQAREAGRGLWSAC
jgi:micrococcal nuclease